MATRRLPMFPLGTVLFPHGIIPLQVFEPRYLQMIAECLAGDGNFGVVLIERGPEVGGGDVRSDIGTEGRIISFAEIDDQRRLILVAGLRRIRVIEWLDDDPYPQAMVADHPDAGGPRPLPGTMQRIERDLERAYVLRSELGVDTAAVTIPTGGMDSAAVFRLAALAPLGPLDAQALLAAPDAPSRADRLAELLAEDVTALQARLAAG